MEGRDVLYDEIPLDPDQVILDVPGLDGKYLNVTSVQTLCEFFHCIQSIKL
jgi:hypothetical protein